MTLFPRATPGKASEVPEKWIINSFYAVVAWSLLGAPNWHKLSAPQIPKLPSNSTPSKSVPVITDTAFTTATTTTALNPVARPVVRSSDQSGVRVICPSAIKVVNIRQSVGLTTVLSTVPCGDRVTITSTDRISSGTEIWVPIEYKNIKGWATARYLDVKI